MWISRESAKWPVLVNYRGRNRVSILRAAKVANLSRYQT